jgi:hypothetical protein
MFFVNYQIQFHSFCKKNPDLTNYGTNEAQKGVFIMIKKEEKGIRKKADLATQLY